MDNFYGLHEIQSDHRDFVGEPAFYLSQLLHQGHPVLPGFVVTDQLFWEFLETINWLEPRFVDFPELSLYFDINQPRQLQIIAQHLCQQMMDSHLPPSSSQPIQDSIDKLKTSALIFYPSLNTPHHLKTSGLFDSVIGWAHTQKALVGLKQAYCEFFRAKSLLYWQRYKIELQNLRPVVLVQPLQSAIASGFVEIRPNCWEINSTWGLEFSLLWGESHADIYLIQPQTGMIQQQKLGSKTIIYNLKSAPDQSTKYPISQKQFGIKNPQLPIHATWISEHQQGFSLNRENLQKLINIIQKIIQFNPAITRLDWRLLQQPQDREPQFYIVGAKCAKIPLSSPSIKSDYSTHQQHFQGLALASGKSKGTAYILTETQPIPSQLPENTVLVVPAITWNYLPLLKQTVAIVAEKGGMTSHGAIVARELGIPAVCGIMNATIKIKTGESIFVDGNYGEVYVIKPEHLVDQRVLKWSFQEQKPIKIPTYINSTPLMVNISQSSSIQRLHSLPLPIDGVGLFRSELIALEILKRSEYPTINSWISQEIGDKSYDFNKWILHQKQQKFIQEMAELIDQMAKILSPRPVYYRALDLREIEQSVSGFNYFYPLVDYRESQNRKLSSENSINRGTFPVSDSPSLERLVLFDLEIKILLKVYELGDKNIHLILPFIRSVEEFTIYKNRIEASQLSHYPEFQVWIMAEVPSILFLLPDYLKAGVQGISIGTNDLTQLLFGIDRNQMQVFPGLYESNPAFKKAIKQLIEIAKTANIPCSICGDAPALYPELIEDLVRWGITSISVNLDAIESTYMAIAKSEKQISLETSRHHL
ncbi:phosphoenolpyruvate synthase [Planktothrix agardhii CCAP 1459/11A]|uniref:Phosphoenolpyruvate synthase n=1 Tax=Planktothrix agardhii CCAP 1459/11A TaxID=282420 RepID=A0A4P5ZXZ2_PLAAG|nr:putative PEP-binding protein [Planktothrix agardhii]GDZ94501.1 phosphoenolpyruvate synthase [Planktothrix agardhii CCAP 1459/11A]CAD5909932.1 Phosphoenolpyruvate synthase [Planktothrix rubescens]